MNCLYFFKACFSYLLNTELDVPFGVRYVNTKKGYRYFLFLDKAGLPSSLFPKIKHQKTRHLIVWCNVGKTMLLATSNERAEILPLSFCSTHLVWWQTKNLVLFVSRKCPLRGHILAPPEGRRAPELPWVNPGGQPRSQGVIG